MLLVRSFNSDSFAYMYLYLLSLCSVKTLLSQVLELRSTNWGFSGTEESAGAYSLHPANDEYYISDYSLAMVC